MGDTLGVISTFFEFDKPGLYMVVLGVVLALSIVADLAASRTRLPRISILMMLGLALAFVNQVTLGRGSEQLLSGVAEPLIQLALVMVAFLLGSEFTIDRLRSIGVLVFLVSLTVGITGFVVMSAGLLLLGFPLVLAISLAAVSVATDPAAVRESVRESKSSGLSGRVLLGVVAIDDAWGIIAFGLAMAMLGMSLDGGGTSALVQASWELGGALVVGAIIGLPAAWLTGRLNPGEPTLVEGSSIVLLLAGLSSLAGVSALLAAMIAGSLVANLARHHNRSFNEIEYIEWPFLVFFFVFSGARVDLYELKSALWLTSAYILLRLLGRFIGGFLSVRLLQARLTSETLPRGIGLALTPQAGVAIGMALLAAERFPQQGDVIVASVVGSTILFEIIGPLLVRAVLSRGPRGVTAKSS